MVRRFSLVIVFAFVLSLAASLAHARPPVNEPPGGLWGETLQDKTDKTDKGLKKATGDAYNYKHIGMACVVMALVGGSLVLLIRYQTRDRVQ